jgi:NCAIR mutase (PurE)-related protein
MDERRIFELAQRLVTREISAEAFLREVAPATVDLGNVQLDVAREARCGFPEVIFADGKDVETLRRTIDRMVAAGTDVLATRVSLDKAQRLLSLFPAGRYNEIARTFRLPPPKNEGRSGCGRVAVVSAGTSDAAVAEEACETLRWMGTEVTLIQDVGVAGPQRLLEKLSILRAADAVVVVAGMEGALPSVVGGHIACPVIAVPTSVGYGASFGGIAALLTMLNSCAANVAVVNIDAGFKAGYVAGMIAAKASSRT